MAKLGNCKNRHYIYLEHMGASFWLTTELSHCFVIFFFFFKQSNINSHLLKEIRVSVLTDSYGSNMPIAIAKGRIAGTRMGCKEHFIINVVQILLFLVLFKDTEVQPCMKYCDSTFQKYIAL